MEGGYRLSAVVGALCISTSALIVRESDASASAIAVLRCGLALPFLYLLTLGHRSRAGTNQMSRKALWLVWFAGASFGLDLVFWSHSINDIGAGLATVLGNLQVVFVAAFSWIMFRESITKSHFISIGLMVLGVVLVSGIFGAAAYGAHPARGVVYGIATSFLYAFFIIGMRVAIPEPALSPGPPYLLMQASFAAALFVSLTLPITHDFRIHGWHSFGWLLLLAMVSQVVGWLLITRAIPHLPAILTSAFLLLQPVSALALSAMLLGETPSVFQVAGVVLILAGVTFAAYGQHVHAA